MKYCEYCGNELGNNAKICPHCKNVPSEIVMARKSNDIKKTIIWASTILIVIVVAIVCCCSTIALSTTESKELFSAAFIKYNSAGKFYCEIEIAPTSSRTSTTSDYYSSNNKQIIKVAYDKDAKVAYYAKFDQKYSSTTLTFEYYDCKNQKHYTYSGSYVEGQTISGYREYSSTTINTATQIVKQYFEKYFMNVTYLQGSKSLFGNHVYYSTEADGLYLSGDMKIFNKKFKTCTLYSTSYTYKMKFDYKFKEFDEVSLS